jgi:hypothetical protein
VRVYKKQRQNFSVARSCAVEKFEWEHTVLEDIWECKEAAFPGDDSAYILHGGTLLFATKDFRKPIKVVLSVENQVFSLRF